MIFGEPIILSMHHGDTSSHHLLSEQISSINNKMKPAKESKESEIRRKLAQSSINSPEEY